MTDRATLDYYRRREEQERALAGRTTLPGIRRIHLDLADRYAAMLSDPGAPRPVLSMAMPKA